MTTLRRLAYATLALATLHVFFGAIVRISGSGMGCGDHWPKCYGHWFPPVDQPTLVIEWTHRLIAALLTTTIVALALTAWARREELGVGGRKGVARSTAFAAGAVLVTALFGAITVWLGNVWYATLGHWALAATVLGALVVTVIRAGGMGGTRAKQETGSVRAARAAAGAAGLALLIILFGGLTATFPGANTACLGFPLCTGALIPALPTQQVQMTHRLLAYVLFFDVLGLAIAFARRREAPVVVRTARIALALVVLQVGVAAAMVELRLPAELRSLHQAIGVCIWLTLFTLAYLARLAARDVGPLGAPVLTPAPSAGGAA